jgi:hypothetical protein
MTDDERGRVLRVARAIEDAIVETGGLDFHAAAEEAIKAMREGEQKREGEARAAGDALVGSLTPVYTFDEYAAIRKANAELHQRAEAAEKHVQLLLTTPAVWHRCRGRIVTYPRLLCSMHRDMAEAQDFDPVEALQAAESLAKAEREGRESEGAAYRKEIAELRADVAKWKANHDNQVTIKRAATTRPDLPMDMHPERLAFIEQVKRLERERDETRKICEGWMANALTSSQQADELSKQIAEAKATIAHWKHLACDPQTRENINAEKVAECERLWALLASVRPHVRGHEMNGSEEAGRAVDEIDRALGAWKTT